MQVVPSSENLGHIWQDVHTGITQCKSSYSPGSHGPAAHQAVSLILKFHKDAMAWLKSKKKLRKIKGSCSLFILGGAVLALNFWYWMFFSSDHMQKKRHLTTVTCQSQNVQGKTREHPHILVSQKERQLLWGSHTASIKKSENWSLPKHRPKPSVPSRNFAPLKSEVIAMNKDLPEAPPNDDLAAPLCN
jgi:hypothetical protein